MKRREFIAAMAATSAATTAEAAGQTPAPAPGKPLTVTLLGTGTPAPSLTRQSSGYLIEVGNDLIVWDHGPGAHQRLIESGRRSIETTHAYRAACGNHRDNAIIAKRAGVKTLVLTHLLGQIDRSRHPRTDRPRDPATCSTAR